MRNSCEITKSFFLNDSESSSIPNPANLWDELSGVNRKQPNDLLTHGGHGSCEVSESWSESVCWEKQTNGSRENLWYGISHIPRVIPLYNLFFKC